MSSAIQSEITKLREKAEFLEAIDKGIQCYPEMRDLVLKTLSMAGAKSGEHTNPPAEKVDPIQRTISPGSAIGKLLAWFAQNGNVPATVAEMAGGASVSAASVRQIVYTKHKDKFDPVGKKPDTRESLFKVKEGVLQ